MPRVPQNTITKTPTMIRTAGGNQPTNGFGALGAALADGAQAIDTQIRRESQVQRQNVAKFQGQAEAINGMIQDVGRGADMMNRAIEMRSETEADRKIAEFQSFLTNEAYGYNDGGSWKSGAFEAYFNPGDETGKGMTGASTAIADRIAAWREKNPVSGRTKEFFDRRAEVLQDRFLSRAGEIDSRNYENYRVESAKGLYQSQVDDALRSGDEVSVSHASATYAYANMPKAAFGNWGEWSKSADRDPEKLEFSSDAAKAQFERLYADSMDNIHAKRANSLLEQAVNSENEEESAAIFDGLRTTNGGLWAWENQKKLTESIARAEEERTRVVASRNVQDWNDAKEITTSMLLGKATEEQAAKFPQVVGRLSEPQKYELQQFRIKTAKAVDMSSFEDFQIKQTEGITAENYPERMEAIKKFAEGLKSPHAREEAIARIESGSVAINRVKKKVVELTNTQLDLWRRFSPLKKSEQLKTAVDLKEQGAIDGVQFMHVYDGMRSEAEGEVDNVQVLKNMKAFGIDVSGAIAVDANGNPKFDARGRAIPAGDPGEKFKTGIRYDNDVGLSIAGVTVRNPRVYELTAETMLAAWDLAREYEVQKRQGVRVEPFADYFKKNIVNTIQYKELQDDQVRNKILQERKRLTVEAESEAGRIATGY